MSRGKSPGPIPASPSVVSEFERRAARAELLARESAAAEEPLRFAAGLYRVQGRMAGAFAAAHADIWHFSLPSGDPEDARRLAEFQRTREGVPWDEVKAWMQSWGSQHERPMPKSHKL